ncbi:IS4 family transposase [Burkholderia sp. BCC1630]|uniref:IS4 family transposase n=1 Tax=Burkholderia sp. BCC1630 TaxID=2676304 RepID=UPI0032658D89
MPHTRLVYVADREADMIALMVRAQELGTSADWLIWRTHDRALPEGAKLWACPSEGEPLGETIFTMGPRRGVKARQVRQHVWLQRIELPAGVGQSVTATCLVAREFEAPNGVRPIEWRLLTNREATNLQEAIELIDWYRVRWEIEILFNVLKNGRRVEVLQFGHDRAARTGIGAVSGRCPDLDADLFVDVDEIRGAYLLIDAKQPAKPKLNEMLRLITRLGGFLGRKGDGEPGAKAIWLGLTEVHVAAKTLQKLRTGGHTGNCV